MLMQQPKERSSANVLIVAIGIFDWTLQGVFVKVILQHAVE